MPRAWSRDTRRADVSEVLGGSEEAPLIWAAAQADLDWTRNLTVRHKESLHLTRVEWVGSVVHFVYSRSTFYV